MKKDLVRINSCPVSGQTLGEEIANCITHGVGLLLSVAALVTLVIMAAIYGNAGHIFSCAVFGTSLVLLYTASTCYHSCRNFKMKRYLQIFDHICIYLLIAGTYTSVTFSSLDSIFSWSLFVIIWLFSVAGIFIKMRYANTSRLCAFIYLFMGWLGGLGIIPWKETLSTGGLVWILAGGIAYSSGILFYLWESLPFAHPIWHVFVLVGSYCHYNCVMFYVIPVTVT